MRERETTRAKVARWVDEAGWHPPWTDVQRQLLDRLATLIDKAAGEARRADAYRSARRQPRSARPPESKPVQPDSPSHGVSVRRRPGGA